MSTSTSSRTDSDTSSLDVEDLLLIGERCRELKKEKDLLKGSQSHGFELIKKLEQHVQRLSEARSQDKKHIQGIQTELSNCYEEIDYLQEQLNARNAEIKSLGDHAHDLEIKLADTEILEQEALYLREGLQRSRMDCLLLRQQLERREEELQKSMIMVDKLEESKSLAALESQCEIETLRLELMALEQSYFEGKKSEEDKANMTELILELKSQTDNTQKSMKTLEKENGELKRLLRSSEANVNVFCKRVEEHFKGWLHQYQTVQAEDIAVSSDQNDKPTTSKEASMCGEVLGPLLLKLLRLGTSNAERKGTVESMSHKIREYEVLIKRLREELKEEKFRAKEEAEDMAQEMAELRYQVTCRLEEECKRRVCIEQASLRRIAELEMQLQIERRKSVASISSGPES